MYTGSIKGAPRQGVVPERRFHFISEVLLLTVLTGTIYLQDCVNILCNKTYEDTYKSCLDSPWLKVQKSADKRIIS